MKLLLLISLLTIFSGCGTEYVGYSAATCKDQGYKGIVVRLLDTKPEISCSDGETYGDTPGYKTNNGRKAVMINNFRASGSTTLHTYIKF